MTRDLWEEPMARAADLLADCLVQLGFDRMFCVPGESYLALLDALHGREEVDLVVCRHEGGAGMMALADGKLTGRPGLVAVSRGPGATNVSLAIHAAEQDAVPLVVLVGQVARHERHRGAFQEVDYARLFGSIVKGVWDVEHADMLPEIMARAVAASLAGTPGPVVVALPEDMLEDRTEAQPLSAPRRLPAAPAPDAVDEAARMLSAAKRPLIIAGGGCASAEGRAALARAAQALGAPVALTFKYQHIFDNSSPLYAGHLGFKIPKPLVDQLSQADLVLAVGTRLGDTPTQGYAFPRAPIPEQPLIHVHRDPAVLGRVHHATLPVAADAAAFLEALATRNHAPADAGWAAACNGVAARMLGKKSSDRPDGVEFGHAVEALAKAAPKGIPLSTDAGNFSTWVASLWPFDGTTECLGAVGGAMGLGVPGAVAAALRAPDGRAVAFCGDGGALMTGNELATAMAKGVKPVIVISDNGTYGTIRMHQERDYPARISGTDLVNPDFAKWGESFGALGLTISAPEEAEAVAARAFAHDGPVVVHVKASAEAITPFATLTQIRGA